jgi:glucose/arabinose dehydrogenase
MVRHSTLRRSVRAVRAMLLSLWAVCGGWAVCAAPPDAGGPTEEDYYRLIDVAVAEAATQSRSERWKPAPDGLPLEVSGMQALQDGRLALAIRKGDIWILDGVYDDPPANVTYQQFAEGLHEPLGLLRVDDGFLVAQRTELTRIRDTNGDGRADEYLAAAQGWGITGNYHEYAYGPERDAHGRLWVTLNIGMGFTPQQRARLATGLHANANDRSSQAAWRGWGLQISPAGELLPIAAGMRSPSGLGGNTEADMFFTDQQGNWVAAGTLHHLRPGVFYGHPDALASLDLPTAPRMEIGSIPAGLPFPEALQNLPSLAPPAVWFPYRKAGQSATDVQCDITQGKFGPFAGQLFVGEFTLAGVLRVFLEKVDGQYQGACFPFRSGFASAVIGSLFAGLSNRGWSSLGQASYGLQRLVWTGRMPFEIQEMRAQPDGFLLRFTAEVDPRTAADPASYGMSSYTYMYHEAYGSDEIQARELSIEAAELQPDGRSVRLRIGGLRRYFVHELQADGVRAVDGRPLLHPRAFYTLNAVPSVANR